MYRDLFSSMIRFVSIPMLRGSISVRADGFSDSDACHFRSVKRIDMAPSVDCKLLSDA